MQKGQKLPPRQKIVHILKIDEDTLDTVREVATIQAIGKASGGLLANPALAPLILGSILAIVGLVTGKEGAEVITDFFAKLQLLFAAKEGEDQRQAASGFIAAQRALIEFFAPALRGLLP